MQYYHPLFVLKDGNDYQNLAGYEKACVTWEEIKAGGNAVLCYGEHWHSASLESAFSGKQVGVPRTVPPVHGVEEAIDFVKNRRNAKPWLVA